MNNKPIEVWFIGSAIFTAAIILGLIINSL